MNILGFNPAHHSSVCLLQDGELKYFIEDERICRIKYGRLPFRTISDVIKNTPIDICTWGTPSMFYPNNTNVEPEDIDKYCFWHDLFISYGHQMVKYEDFSREFHHLMHSSHAFYNSGFTKALSIVVDGLGSGFLEEETVLRETESVYECSYPNNFILINKKYTDIFTEISIARSYEIITKHLGWDINEAGKTMGLSSYGKPNPNVPDILMYLDHNRGIFKKGIDGYSLLDLEKNPQLKFQTNPKEWHHNKSKITDLEKDLAWKIQNDTQQKVGDYIEKSIQETGLKQVCCAGGYFLNCVANYYLTKRFPDVEFYFEPIANDAGTAIGAAKLIWHSETKDMTIRPLKSLYLGKQYSKEELLEGIKKYT
jgi:carbamoyltransferase